MPNLRKVGLVGLRLILGMSMDLGAGRGGGSAFASLMVLLGC